MVSFLLGIGRKKDHDKTIEEVNERIQKLFATINGEEEWFLRIEKNCYNKKEYLENCIKEKCSEGGL